jgi:YVTN family beta-propeller protein
MSAVMMFDWGDSSSNGGYDIRFPYDHYYAKPGTYVVKCRLVHYRPHWNWQEVETRYGDWSNPCTLQILRDTLTHPDSVYAKVELGHHASWSCVLPNGSAVYVTSGDDNSVYVLDPGTNSCTQRIPVQSGPSCCVASAAGDRVYVANHGSNSISAIRTTGNSVVDTITLPAAPDRLALLPRRHAALCLARGHEPSLRCTA